MKTVVLLLTLALTAISAAASSAGRERGDDVSFSGTWKTIANGTHQYTVILKQIGKKVTGNYSPGNGKIVDGVVSDNKLTFKWTQDGGNKGTGEFTMDEDGKGFTGSASALKPKEFTVSWNTYTPPVTSKAPEKVTPPPAVFTGVWRTILGDGKEIEVSLQQTADKVSGTYMPGDAHIKEGVVTGRVLRFQWTRWEDGLTGSGRFEMGSDGNSISGSWNPSRDPDAAGSPWNGTLKPVSFTGVWRTMLAIGKEIEVSLTQTGDKVTGTYMPGGAEIKDGVVTGGLLNFQWKQEDGLSGSGSFQIVGDGNSISGSWNPSTGPNAAGTGWYGTLEPLSFAGCWKLTGGMMPGETICLKQDNSGRVTYPEFAGTVAGNALRFTHHPAGDERSGHLFLDKGGKSFHGFYHPGKDTELNENPCTGILVPTPPPATFAGVWRAKWGDTGMLELILQQSGDQVTGQARGNSGDVGVIIGGRVVGNALTFNIMRPRTPGDPRNFPDVVVGIGELVMDKGGKSFTGNVLGTATSGVTLIAR